MSSSIMDRTFCLGGNHRIATQKSMLHDTYENTAATKAKSHIKSNLRNFRR